MSEQEYYSRKLTSKEYIRVPESSKKLHSLCKSPFTGFYIGPQGHIVLCCMSQTDYLAHINNVDDLESFYNDSVMEKYRKELELGLYPIMKPCSTCYKLEKKELAPLKTVMEDYMKFNNFDDDWKARKNGKNRPIRYLEYTLSNICNADCATCGSSWSSKWEELDRKFGRKVFPMVKVEDKQIAKIEKVLYGLEILTIKGGEPFADIRNLRILKTLAEVNPNCHVDIISNFHAITPEAIEILANMKKVFCSASIDAVTPETYKWIRGGDFEKTITNMKKVYQATGRRILVSVTTSLYNYFLLDEIKDYFEDKDYVKSVKFTNLASQHHITTGLLPEDMYNKQMNKLKKAFENKIKPGDDDVIGLVYENVSKPSSGDNDRKKVFFDNLDKMNEHRGFDLCDYVPELKEWRQHNC